MATRSLSETARERKYRMAFEFIAAGYFRASTQNLLVGQDLGSRPL